MVNLTEGNPVIRGLSSVDTQKILNEGGYAWVGKGAPSDKKNISFLADSFYIFQFLWVIKDGSLPCGVIVRGIRMYLGKKNVSII